MLGAPVTLFCMFVLAFAGDGYRANGAPICSMVVEGVVIVLPPASLLTGLVLCVTGVVRAMRGRSALTWVTAGWLVFPFGVVVAFVLAIAGT